MRNKYKQILLLYLRNPSFVLTSGIFLASAVISKVLYLAGRSAFAEDVATILFVSTLWLAFHTGLLVKRQFANHRAALLPYYRKPHLHCVSLVYLLFVLVAVLWEYGLVPLVTITPHGLHADFCYL